MLYILDEPSIGLHQRDNARLIATMERLRDLGNTVIVVEHDEETIRAADFVVRFASRAKPSSAAFSSLQRSLSRSSRTTIRWSRGNHRA